jgi:hypothetical protein
MLPSPCRGRGHAGVGPLWALVGDGNPSTVRFGQPAVGHLPSSGLPGGLANDAGLAARWRCLYAQHSPDWTLLGRQAPARFSNVTEAESSWAAPGWPRAEPSRRAWSETPDWSWGWARVVAPGRHDPGA